MEPEKKSAKEIFYFYGSLVLLTILISAGALLYRSGYRLENFHLSKTGSLEVAVYEAGSKIYLDDVLQNTTSAEEETLSFSKLSPDTHTLTITKDGLQTLQENISIVPEKTVKVSTLLLPTSLKIDAITDPEEKKQVAFLFENSATPTVEHKRSLADTAVWADGNLLYALWTGDANSIPEYLCKNSSPCEAKPVLVFTADDTITNVDFYEDRPDVAVVSSGTRMSIVEMNASGGTLSHYILGGKDLDFYKESSDTLYVKNGQGIFRMTL